MEYGRMIDGMGFIGRYLVEQSLDTISKGDFDMGLFLKRCPLQPQFYGEIDYYNP